MTRAIQAPEMRPPRVRNEHSQCNEARQLYLRVSAQLACRTLERNMRGETEVFLFG
jgi:hypothetical protein